MAMTLDRLELRTPARIRGLSSLQDEERVRLAGLGLRDGATIIKLLRTPLRDPIECLVGSQLLTLDASLMRRIEVDRE